ncbi:MAG: 23S rRNA (adenine(2030)-N(6))-methyltransferase RlmJ [Chromatiaceae bacterium]|nr:23S rRNA (adenine(2030)-N(6))-methyltransferase RlmJ [Gammaproteobacteria bacterium]MCP5305847.1 23S rRNA (adenine(2030)-N(6))-methyltransferase RlmJ [Chromatiaceae bacterium]MCP5312703.1 23S rRNA (adenine(2030)-N(6))-methyltransferase RlmJ [Chromatiaceae bacterium]
MLSYRHAFHAGNHADVLKHYVLCAVLGHYNRKDAPYWYIDTHAGAGRYDLHDPKAALNAEYRTGIGPLWDLSDLSPELSDYVALVRRMNPGGALRRYPGSPALAAALIRAQDRMRLFEMHPNDAAALRAQFRERGRQVVIAAEDGFAGLPGLLPPPTRRAVVLIDPPYEVKADYHRVEEALRAALRRFATGTFLVWYPLLRRREVAMLSERLRRLPLAAWLHCELAVRDVGEGMYGSGLFVVNPPWTLPRILGAGLPELARHLAQDGTARFTLDDKIP